MNAVDHLAAELLANPTSTIYAAMLAAELVEGRGMLATEAARHVAAVERAGLFSADLAHAAELMTSDLAPLAVAVSAVALGLQLDELDDATFVLVAGDARPHLAEHPQCSTSRTWGTCTVTVGASWLIRLVRRESR